MDTETPAKRLAAARAFREPPYVRGQTNNTRRLALEHRIYELPLAESGRVALELLEDINHTPDKDRIYLLDLMVRNYLKEGSPIG